MSDADKRQGYLRGTDRTVSALVNTDKSNKDHAAGVRQRKWEDAKAKVRQDRKKNK